MDSANAALLWAACRPSPDGSAVIAAIARGADLPRCTDLAIAQRVSPLLWRALQAAGSEVPEGDWRERLLRDTNRCRAHALLVLPRLGPTALRPLAEAGMMPLVFKGAAIAGRYPEPGLRPMDDVDLVLPRPQLGAAVRVLERMGWRSIPLRRAHLEVVLVHPELPGLPLELHKALASWRERSNHLTTADLWDWRAPGSAGGESAFTLPVEEEIVAMAAHAAKPFHVFDRLIWIVDLAVVVADAERRDRPVDWNKVATLAAAARCRTGLSVALNQAARLCVSSPQELRRLPAVHARARAVMPLLSSEWPLTERDWGMRSRLRYALADDWRQRVTLLIGQAIEGGPAATPRRAVQLCLHGVRRWVNYSVSSRRHRRTYRQNRRHPGPGLDGGRDQRDSAS
jgi:hypothetical protein